MNAIRTNVNASYKLVSDIDLSAYAASDGGKGWKPVEGNFSGSLDGDGHRITGLYIDRGNDGNVGLFSSIYSGKIVNVKIIQADVKGGSTTGILAGSVVFATLSQVYTSGRVQGNQEVGGLVGKLEDSNASYTGSSATVEGNAYNVGGLIGHYYGGNGELADNYAEGDVHAAGSSVGGLVGFSISGTIKRSYASGNVVSDQETAGGLLGTGNSGSIQDSYALGSVKGTQTVGGLVGYFNGIAIANSYSTGHVDADNSLGGFGGYSYGSTVTNSFWDETASGRPYSYGWSSDPSGVTSLTTSGMQNSANFAGWNFNGTWAGASGTSYPYLQDNAPLWLTHLAVSPNAGISGTLTPTFHSATKQYNISVTNVADSVTITAPAANGRATVAILGGTTLAAGNNTVTLTVSDGNGRDQVYTLHVHKLASNALSSDAQLSDLQVNGVSIPGFNGSTETYSVPVPNTATTATITAVTRHPDASYAVTGCSNLVLGSNLCTVTVTASDGTQKIYSLTVIRNRFAGGEGTAASPYLIATADQLNEVRNDYQKVFRLTADIDLSSYASADGGEGWKPIYFEGVLDGNGHSITGLTIRRPNEDIIGLFQYIYLGSVSNLKLVQAAVTGRDKVGMLVGWHSSGTVTNVSASGTVSGRDSVGGLIGYVTYGSVSMSGSIAAVAGSGSAIGGLIGLNEGGTVDTSYAEGNVQGSSTVGGLVGSDRNSGKVSNSYATGQVTSVQASAGGLIGKTQSGTYKNNYATGKVTGGSAVGGLVGTKTSGTFTNSYWNKTTSGMNSGVGSGTATGITGYTTDTMKLSASYNTWDFSTVWNIVSGTTTPYLRGTAPLWLTSLTVTPDSGASVPVSPSVDNMTSAYTAVVASNAHSVTVTGTRLNPADTLTVTGGTNLVAGTNPVTITVASSTGFGSRAYALNVVRSDPSAAGLSSLTLSSGTLSPSFTETVTDYTASVAYSVTALTVTPVVSNLGSTVKVNGVGVASGQASGSISLTAGTANTVMIEVTSEDGTQTKTYTVIVTRAAGSSNANLSALTTSGGALSPTFAAGTVTYTIPTVANTTSSITVRPTVADSTATVKVKVNEGTDSIVTSGTNSPALPLNVGSNSIVVTVTAQDGTTKSYTISVTRAASTVATLAGLTLSSGALSPTFNANTMSYTSTAANSYSSVTVTPTVTNSNATVTVSVNSGTPTPVVSGQSSAPLALNTGSNIINVVVTAQDGTTTKTYKITVTRNKSNNADMTAFSFEGLSPAVSGTISGTAISLTVPYGTNRSALVATFTSAQASSVQVGSILQTSGVTANNFNAPVVYKVTAEDGTTTKNYTVTVSESPAPLSGANDIVGFTLAEQTGAATIQAATHSVAIEVADGTNLSSLAPTVAVSPHATVSPASGATVNFSNGPVSYTVTAQNGATQVWTVTVSEAPAPLSGANDLVGFTLAAQTGSATIQVATHTVTIEVAHGTNLAALAPTVTVSTYATVSPTSGATVDFSNGPVSYTVIAQNGATQVWMVTVIEASAPLSGANDIVSFTLAAQTGAATIQTATHTVEIEVAHGTNLSTLVPTVTVSTYATVNPGSGATLDFSSAPVSYTVTAQNGTAQVWTVTVSEAPAPLSGANDIVSFTLAAQTGSATIQAATHSVEIEVAHGTNLSTLAPTVTVSAHATLSPASGATVNFSGGAVSYTVTAQNGATQVWTVTVIEASAPLSGAKDIVSFALASQTGAATIQAATHTVMIAVAQGTNLSSLAPTVTVSTYATVSPASGATVDFSNGPVSYTVTAPNGDTQVWTVTVSEAPAPLSGAKDIVSFVLAAQTSAATIQSATNTVTIEVTHGTNLSSLAPTVTVSTYATVSPASGTTVDFSNGPVRYTVTAQNGTQQTYLVAVNLAPLVPTSPGSGGGGGSSSPAVTPTSANGKLILPAGSSGIAKLDDEIVVTIPAGATDQDMQLTIEKWLDLAKLNMKNVVLISSVFEVTKNVREHFKKPVSITIIFDPNQVPKGQTPAIYYYDEAQKLWIRIGGEVRGNQVTAQTDHFTRFAVLTPREEQATQPENTQIRFSDIRGHWAAASIDQAVAKRLANGYPDGTFQPDRSITRAEYAVMLFRAMILRQEESGELLFKERIGSWAKQAIGQLVKMGVVSGYEDGSFQPDREITRTEMTVMLARTLNTVYGIEGHPTYDLAVFDDHASIPEWAKAEIATVVRLGIVQGQAGNRFAPVSLATRAEAITVLLRVLELKK
ncbi:cadherin-like beta sandwich domain-containing protein [Paenibacillus hodogayensis]|uniref:Cadherin-like beta sandwich domain-containing protein n=1 Tax=Paenibacillus hodogayensis TaxID=279208 RepID=A0ABV5W0L6_9BACL